MGGITFNLITMGVGLQTINFDVSFDGLIIFKPLVIWRVVSFKIIFKLFKETNLLNDGA